MPEYTRVDPLASFAAYCCLCTVRRPVDKEGMCSTHYAQFGSKAWKAGAAAPPQKKVRAFSLQLLYKDPRVESLAAAEEADAKQKEGADAA